MTLSGRSWMMMLLPGSSLLIATAILVQTSLLPASAAPLVDAYPFVVVVAGILLACRFHSTRVLFGVLLMTIAARALVLVPPQRPSALLVFCAIAILLPVNLVALSLTRERGILISDNGFRLAILGLQCLIVTLLCRPELASGAALLERAFPGLPWTRLPAAALVAFLLALCVLLLRLLLYRQPLDVAFFWALLASYLGLEFGATPRATGVWLATAALALVASLIESSYRMAYQDELTGLPGRRAFNEALLRLGDRCAIAVVDVDRFKSFNDTYGHDIGDQVLRMVAARLARVTGGGEAFRCGGEEFAVIFAKNSAEDALPHLERLRRAIEETSFTVRGFERRAAGREGSERRTPGRARARAASTSTRVTISIGVAEPSARLHAIEQVLRAADKALYRAKEGGRNRIEVGGSRIRSRFPEASWAVGERAPK